MLHKPTGSSSRVHVFFNSLWAVTYIIDFLWSRILLQYPYLVNFLKTFVGKICIYVNFVLHKKKRQFKGYFSEKSVFAHYLFWKESVFWQIEFCKKIKRPNFFRHISLVLSCYLANELLVNFPSRFGTHLSTSKGWNHELV